MLLAAHGCRELRKWHAIIICTAAAGERLGGEIRSFHWPHRGLDFIIDSAPAMALGVMSGPRAASPNVWKRGISACRGARAAMAAMRRNSRAVAVS